MIDINHWDEITDDMWHEKQNRTITVKHYECSNCHATDWQNGKSNYCWNCGRPMLRKWKPLDVTELKDRYWYLIVVEGFGTPLKAQFRNDCIPEFKAFGIDGKTGDPKWLWFEPKDIQYWIELPDFPKKED